MFDNIYHPSMVVWYWLWWFDGIISTTLSQHIRDLRRIADRLAELIWTADLWAASPMLRKAGPGQETQPELGMVKSWSKFSSPCRLVPPIEVLLMWMLGKTLKTPPYEYYSSFHIYHKTTLKPLICFNCTLSFWGPCETERLGIKDRSIGRFWTASHELIMREWGPVCEIAKLVKMTIYMILQTS